MSSLLVVALSWVTALTALEKTISGLAAPLVLLDDSILIGVLFSFLAGPFLVWRRKGKCAQFWMFFSALTGLLCLVSLGGIGVALSLSLTDFRFDTNTRVLMASTCIVIPSMILTLPVSVVFFDALRMRKITRCVVGSVVALVFSSILYGLGDAPFLVFEMFLKAQLVIVVLLWMRPNQRADTSRSHHIESRLEFSDDRRKGEIAFKGGMYEYRGVVQVSALLFSVVVLFVPLTTNLPFLGRIRAPLADILLFGSPEAGGQNAGVVHKWVQQASALIDSKERLRIAINGSSFRTKFQDLDGDTLLASLPLLTRPEAKTAVVLNSGFGTVAELFGRVRGLDITVVEPLEIWTRFQSTHSTEKSTIPPQSLRTFLRENEKHFDVMTVDLRELISSESVWLVGKTALNDIGRTLGEKGVLALHLNGSLASKKSIERVLNEIEQHFSSIRVFRGRAAEIVVLATNSLLDIQPDPLKARGFQLAVCLASRLGHSSLQAIERREIPEGVWETKKASSENSDIRTLAQRDFLERRVMDLPFFAKPKSAEESVIDAALYNARPAVVQAIRQQRKPFSPREILAVIGRDDGLSILGRELDNSRYDSKAPGLPWEAPLATASLALIPKYGNDGQSMVRALRSLDAIGCASKRIWRLAVWAASETARRDPESAAAIASAVLPSNSDAYANRRREISEHICRRPTAACGVRR